jgi:hypothetical protein
MCVLCTSIAAAAIVSIPWWKKAFLFARRLVIR